MIKRLDSEVSSRIAAGEVIERPSSVAKELIENSIDASAQNITLYIEQGGKSSFVIEDDGCGIPFEELPLALERYATSKISTLDDLERISTLGYRGEALSSVAAVSRMEIRSRERTSETGGIIKCEGGAVILHTESPTHPGTRIQVDDLFYNLPARRKFLKTASAELRRILQVVNDYALVNPELTFRVFSDGKRILELLPPGSTDKALERRWGDETPIYSSATSFNSNNVKIWWNPIPDSRRTVITIFVNARRIQDPTIRSAVCGGESAAYGEWLVILEMPPEDLDVNIHPAKEEVRFRRSGDIYKLILQTTRKIFSRKYAFTSEGTPQMEEKAPFPFSETRRTGWFDRTDPMFSQTPWKPVSEVTQTPERVSSPETAVFIPAGRPDPVTVDDRKNYIGQTAKGFLIFDLPNGIAIVDPHAAHERILYEEIAESFKEGIATQNLTIPFEVPASLLPEINIFSKELNDLAFIFEEDRLAGVPMLRGRSKLSPLDMLRSALRGIEVEKDPEKRDREVWWRMARLACRDAVKLGRRFEREEAETLMDKLQACSSPFTCPHGRPTIFLIENRKLEDWFER
ncbi:MAG: DNA mismatch repair endonuclease MutL [Synergistaceae bacterium]|jgi:DNA mismatch repair protein MutL|nr:DNA mismatch repair endonuclease MutL [Synergistaceae bacterium]MDD4750578.1 DNA mismatch repair endonuclease MutL [Synergistaceae bacterium]MDD4837959.1 DNA mismatch repair endonuclease MutL [Synergistaceae bacterium]